MNDELLMNLLRMFIDQFIHAVTVAEDTLDAKGEKALRDELQAEYSRRVTAFDQAMGPGASYEFIDALVLPSLLLTGLYIDLVLARIEIVQVGDHKFEVQERGKVQ